MEKLTMQEEEVMRLIWQIGPCFVKDILAKYDDPRPPYTTLASIVKNLERKKYVKNKRYGNTYEYTPLIPESEYKRTFMSGVVRNYFEDSYKEMVSCQRSEDFGRRFEIHHRFDRKRKRINLLTPYYHDTGICLLSEGECSLCTLLRLLPSALL